MNEDFETLQELLRQKEQELADVRGSNAILLMLCVTFFAATIVEFYILLKNV